MEYLLDIMHNKLFSDITNIESYFYHVAIIFCKRGLR